MAPETPRAVSSRLLTMKFMQRAAASTSSPDSDAPSSKKRRIEDSSPQGRFSAAIDAAAVKAALQDQETKRTAALEQHKAADTHWVLKPTMATGSTVKTTTAKPLNIVYVGYGEIDSADDSADGEDVPSQGRTSTRKAKPAKVETKSEEDNERESSSDEDLNRGAGRKRSASQASTNRSRSQSRSKPPSAESSKAKEFRDKRKKKDVRGLNTMRSISTGGGNAFSSSPAARKTNRKS